MLTKSLFETTSSNFFVKYGNIVCMYIEYYCSSSNSSVVVMTYSIIFTVWLSLGALRMIEATVTSKNDDIKRR